MRKFVLFTFVIALVSCQQGKIDRMQAVQDSLTRTAVEKDSAIIGFVSAMTEIQENLDSIKQIEDIVRIESAKVGEGGQSAREQIRSDIAAIHELMQQNKALIAKLQKQLGSSNAKVAELQRAIVVLRKQVEQKDAEIAGLKAEMEKLHLDLAGMTSRMEEMAAESKLKDEVLMQKTTTIDAQTIALNTGYYAFGSQKELIENDLVEKDGGFLGIGKRLKLREELNADYFTEVDIRELSRLELHARKAKLVTSHPSGSYHFEGDNLVEALVIDDPQEFWKTSKFLVIVVN
jgi:chromosome segregation ATPase